MLILTIAIDMLERTCWSVSFSIFPLLALSQRAIVPCTWALNSNDTNSFQRAHHLWNQLSCYSCYYKLSVPRTIVVRHHLDLWAVGGVSRQVIDIKGGGTRHSTIIVQSHSCQLGSQLGSNDCILWCITKRAHLLGHSVPRAANGPTCTSNDGKCKSRVCWTWAIQIQV